MTISSACFPRLAHTQMDHARLVRTCLVLQRDIDLRLPPQRGPRWQRTGTAVPGTGETPALPPDRSRRTLPCDRSRRLTAHPNVTVIASLC